MDNLPVLIFAICTIIDAPIAVVTTGALVWAIRRKQPNKWLCLVFASSAFNATLTSIGYWMAAVSSAVALNKRTFRLYVAVGQTLALLFWIAYNCWYRLKHKPFVS